MRRFGPLLLAAALLGAAIPVLAVSESAPDDLEHNRRLLDRYRADPEHYARLVRDLHAFQALPADRQERMRQFDRDLHEQDPANQNRLWGVLERYGAWVGRLPEADRQRIDEAGDRTERLAVVKELRQKEWNDRLPNAERVDLLTLPEPRRSARLAALRKEEARRRQEWQDWADGQKTRPGPGPRSNRPARLADFPTDVQTFVLDKLTPMLTDEEKDQLKNAEGKWPLLACTILDLSEKRPVLPPLARTGPVVRYDQLPPEVKRDLPQDRLKKQNLWDDLHKKEEKWPQFALAVADLMKQEKRTPPPLGASRPAEFSADVQTFIEKKLLSELKAADQAKLREAEGRWPDYPLGLLELAHKTNLEVPDMSLPGPRDLWNDARTALPDVPDRLLFEFARTELTPQERANLKLAKDDPAGNREILKEAYFKKYPHELQRLRRLERRAAAEKP